MGESPQFNLSILEAGRQNGCCIIFDMPNSIRILIIDDDKPLLQGLAEMFKREGYEILSTSSGKEGIQLAIEHAPQLIICDMMMPPPDGVQVIKTLSENPATTAIPFVFLTARAGESNVIQGFDLGADDYISKPFVKSELLARIRAILRRKGLTQMEERTKAEEEITALRATIGELFEKFSTNHVALAEALAHMLSLRDNETEEHGRRVVELCEKLGNRLGLQQSELVQIRLGALLHDIGKVGIPDSVLRKPGALNESERMIMQRHSTLGFEIAKHIGFDQIALDVIHHHHEHWDGKGYPDGLAGDAIPMPARVFAIVDVWDALTSDRPYRQAWPDEKAREYIAQQEGALFDPKVVSEFLTILDL